MEKIALTESVFNQVAKLASTLLRKGYFSYSVDAQAYVNNLVDFIYTIPSQKHYQTKRHKYGHYYCRYKPNNHTAYYITFDTDGTRYIVKNIISSHTPQYPRYIKGM